MKKTNYPLDAFLIMISLFIYPLHAVEEGTLTVTTDPEGVEVWLDDKYVGDAPIQNRKLKTGKYFLKLIDPVQQVSTTEEIVIQAEKTTVIEKSLKTKFGTLKVESEPEGAEVLIYTSLGKTPLTNNFMNPGKYRIEVKSPKKRYIPASSELTIPQGKTVEVSNTLEKRKLLNTKTLIGLVLGAGAIGGFVWGLVEQGYYKQYKTYANEVPTITDAQKTEYKDKANSAAVQRTLGIILGSACVVGVEIVLFF